MRVPHNAVILRRILPPKTVFTAFSGLLKWGSCKQKQLGIGLSVIVKQKWFEKISSPHVIRICVGVLRKLGFYIYSRQ